MDKTNIPEDNWESKLIDYTLGVMDSGEAEQFALSLAECRQHVQLAQQYEQTMGWIGAAAKAVEPPVGHQARLMARIGATPQSSTGAPTVPVLLATSEATVSRQVLTLRRHRRRPWNLSQVRRATESDRLDSLQGEAPEHVSGGDGRDRCGFDPACWIVFSIGAE